MRLPTVSFPVDCPACKRYIGRATTVCPYCDVDIPVTWRLSLIRIGALVLAFGGLLLLWAAATGISGDNSNRNSHTHSRRRADAGAPYLANATEMGRTGRPRHAATTDTGRSGISCTKHMPNPAFRLYTVIKPHLHWMVWCSIVCLLLSEPTQPVTAGKAGWRRVLTANRPTAMALLVFFLSGTLGFIVLRVATLHPGIILLGIAPAIGIATLPLLYVQISGRHTLGIILLPLACELSGLSPTLASLLRLS